MIKIYDADGNVVAEIPSLSEKLHAILEAGGEITMIFHTPQLMRGALGERNGSFSLRWDGDVLVTTTPAAVKTYAEIQAGIAAIKAAEAGHA